MKNTANSPMNQQGRRTLFLCFLVLILSTYPMLASADRVLLGKRDGIELYVGKPVDSTTCLSFFVINTNDYPLNYIDNGRGNRFSFTLLDRSDHVVEQIPRWHRWNDPYASDVGKRATAQIAAGQRLEFIICLDEAYGDNWSSGATLIVKWEPQHANEGRIPVGWELEAKCDPGELLSSLGATGDVNKPMPKGAPGDGINEGDSRSIKKDAENSAKVDPVSPRPSGGNEGRSIDVFGPVLFVVSLVGIVIILVFLYLRFIADKDVGKR